MIIKTNEFELEIFQGADVYLGSRKSGQTFKKWSEIDEDVKIEFEKIAEQAENLVKHAKKLLSTTTNA
jgi:hypothetical protein